MSAPGDPIWKALLRRAQAFAKIPAGIPVVRGLVVAWTGCTGNFRLCQTCSNRTDSCPFSCTSHGPMQQAAFQIELVADALLLSKGDERGRFVRSKPP